MIEVEVKAKIDSFKKIKEELAKLPAKKTKTEYQEDIYFNSPIVDFAQTDESLRIRKTTSENKKNIFITYKGPKIDSESKTREELEIAIEDGKKARKILENIGFKEVRTVVKNRENYKYKNFKISLDNVEGLDPYIEIEIDLDDGSKYSEDQKSIFKLFEKLQITDGFERTSYLELLESIN